MSESMRYLINWELDQQSFRRQVRDLIHKAQKGHKVIALPMEVTKGNTFLNLMTLLLAQVNCDHCDAPCCRVNPGRTMTSLLPPEYQRLSAKYGKEHFIMKDGQTFLPMPCPFLKNNQCVIYPDRPLVCVIYPFQPGASDGDGNLILAVASSCPEAVRITKQVYMTAWRIRRQFNLLGEGNFLRGIFEG